MKTKRSRRLYLMPLLLTAGLAVACKSADGADASAPGQGAPNDGAPRDPGTAPTRAEPTFAWARALDWQTGSLTTATAPNGETIVVGVTETDGPIVVDALSFKPPTTLTMFVARFAADGAPLYLRELAHAVPSGEFANIYIHELAVDAQGGFALTGSFNTDTVTLADGTAVAGRSGYVLRCAADGTASWHDDVPGEGASALAFNAQGDLAVSSAERHTFQEIDVPGQLVLRLYGADGTMKWQRAIEDKYNDAASSAGVQFAPDGALHWSGLMRPGYLTRFAGPTGENEYLKTGGPYVLFSAKYGPDGKPFFEDSYAVHSPTDAFPLARTALDESGNAYVLMSLEAATIELPGLSGADGVSFDGGIIKFDAQGVPQGLLPFSWGETTFVAAFERAPGGRLVVAGTTAEPITFLAAGAGKNVELVTALGGRDDGFLLVVDAAGGQAQSDLAFGDAFDQRFEAFAVNPSGAFSLQGQAEGSMQLGGLTVGDASSPGSHIFLAAGSF